MPAPAVDGGTRVRRVRLLAVPADPAALRLRAGRLLGGLALAPPGLPPAAVLVVRRLADPRPGTLALGAGAMPVAWERAVDAALAALARRAARPADGPVPATAEAVLFADHAEVLACAARDALRGELGVRWWWAALGVADRVAVARAWVDAPAEAPAALSLLAASAPAFLESLPVETVRELHARVVALHPAPGVREALRSEGSTWTPEVAALIAFAVAAPGGALEARDTARPLADVPAAAAPGLGPPRAPRAVRASIAAEPEAGAQTAGAPPSPVAGAVPGAEARSDAEPLAPAARRPGEVATPSVPVAPARLPAPAPAAGVRRPVPERRAAPRPAVVGAVLEPGRNPNGDSPAPAPEPAPPPARDGEALAPRPAHDTRSGPHPSFGTATPTRLGGLFYLLDAALALELYGDFTTPLEPGIALDPWDFVALLGAHLLSAPMPDDPVWPLLAHLAGRAPDVAPGTGFAAPRAWRMPDAWLAPFEPAALTVRREGARLVHWHPEGFAVVDLPVGPDACRNPLDRWVGWIGAYLRARIGPELCAAMLVQPARVHVTATRVDVVLSLAELPIEVRLAGLDRTPGWIPAARRHVELHFE